jgi:hypothetical protein
MCVWRGNEIEVEMIMKRERKKGRQQMEWGWVVRIKSGELEGDKEVR